MSSRELVASVDIEHDNDDVTRGNLLSVGIAVLTIDKQLVASFEANLLSRPERRSDPRTLDWWLTQPVAHAQVMKNRVPHDDGIRALVKWYKKVAEKLGYPYLAAMPVGADIPYLYGSVYDVAGKIPWRRPAFDVRTAVSQHFKVPYLERLSNEQIAPFVDELPARMEHRSYDDALEQGLLAVNVIRHTRGLTRINGYVDVRDPKYVVTPEILAAQFSGRNESQE